MHSEQRKARRSGAGRGHITAVFLALLIALCAAAVINMCVGSVAIPVPKVVGILFGGADAADAHGAIIWKIRLPRVLMSAILGGGLALSGFLLQTFFGNPIAGPFVLGISSGAKLTVALTMVYGLRRLSTISSWTMVGAAFVGSLLAVSAILLLSTRLKGMSVLLVGGIMISYLCSAATDFVVTFAENADIVNLRGWSMGSFSGSSWEGVAVAAALVGLGTALAFCLSKPISAYQLGEAYARSVGMNILRFRVALIVLSSLLSACVTAFAGPISFVGIAVPHLIRRALNTSRPLIVVPASFLGGALFCMICDLITRTAFAPMELNISTVTAVFGAPVVIGMLLSRRAAR